MDRRLLALGALVALGLLAGCTGGPSGAQLNAPASYDWDVEANATYDVHTDLYSGVYRVHEGQSVALYQHLEIGGETAIRVQSVQFRYPDGSILYPNGTLRAPDGSTSQTTDELTVDTRDERTVVTAPADGKLAYTSTTSNKAFRVPIVVGGSHEVILPEDMRIGVPLLGTASPGGYERHLVDDRVHMVWSETPGATIDLSYYLERDFYIYTGMVAALLLVALGGTLYFRRQIRELERVREESGLGPEG